MTDLPQPCRGDLLEFCSEGRGGGVHCVVLQTLMPFQTDGQTGFFDRGYFAGKNTDRIAYIFSSIF